MYTDSYKQSFDKKGNLSMKNKAANKKSPKNKREIKLELNEIIWEYIKKNKGNKNSSKDKISIKKESLYIILL